MMISDSLSDSNDNHVNGYAQHHSPSDYDEDVVDEKNYRRSLIDLHKALRQETLINIESCKVKQESGAHREWQFSSVNKQMYSAFCHLYEHLENIDGILLEILDFAPYYDFKECKANGYRSLVKTVQSCLTHLMALVRHISVNKNSYTFRASHYTRELESYTMTLGQLRDVLRYTRKLMGYSPKGQLMPSEELLDTAVADEIQMEMDMIDQECFYGRTLGFQYCESLKRAFEIVHIGLASFSHNYQDKTPAMFKLAGSIFSSRKYVLNPEVRAEKVVEVTLNCNIEFCKAFWNLTESNFFHNVATLSLPTCQVNYVFQIEPRDLTMSKQSGGTITVPSPSAHIGHQQLQLRLMSYKYRLGQENIPGFTNQSVIAEPPSDCLIIQCHGGGFVSQTSRTHEAYLRLWARDINVPILCIDYSLAPAAPFPRALQEVYYAYCWALKNSHMLGTTAKRIVVVGDSAGGNLLFATMLRAIQDGIKLPDGIVAIYTPVYVQYIPSPSRTLSIMDALLPVGILTTCLEAYAGDLIEPWKGGNKSEDKSQLTKDESVMGSMATLNQGAGTNMENATTIGNPGSILGDYGNTAVTAAIMQEEDDEEIQSFFSNQSEASEVDKVTNKLQVADVADNSQSKANSKLFSHKRSSFKIHNRSESLPVTPRVPQLEPPRHDKMRHFAQSPLYKFAKIRIKQDPLISPLHASDELLSRMPPTNLVACHLDPCLDDSVMFAKKLDSLGVQVNLDAIDGVPHGFLNFNGVSKECMQATDICRDRLRDVLGIKLPNSS